MSALQERIAELEQAKQQTWEEKERLSNLYNQERSRNLANKGILDVLKTINVPEKFKAEMEGLFRSK